MCDKSFSSDTYMKKYMTSVHEERKAFKCTFCKKSFKCTFCEKSSSLVENPWSGNQKRLSKNSYIVNLWLQRSWGGSG